MKYNTTYDQKGTLKETLKKVQWIKDQFIDMYDKRFKFIEVSTPQFVEEDSELLVNFRDKTRHISFDNGDDYSVGKLLLSNTNYLRKLSSKFDMKDKEGLRSFSTSIWRDIEQTSTVSASKDELVFHIKFDDKKDAVKFANNEVYELHLHIYRLTKELKTNSSMDVVPDSFSTQDLENMMPELSSKDRIQKLIDDRHSLILENRGKKLLSSKVHEYTPPTLYDLNNERTLFYKDNISSASIEVATISVLSNGQDLSDQLKIYKQAEYLEYDFYSALAKEKHKILEIRINIPAISMVLLEKGHIAEVQAGTISNDVKHIKERYKIDTL